MSAAIYLQLRDALRKKDEKILELMSIIAELNEELERREKRIQELELEVLNLKELI